MILPEASAWCYVRTDPDHANLSNFEALHPLEKVLVSKAVDARKAEFGDARWCAHQVLKDLGYPSTDPILRGQWGMPLWPEGVVGALTHTSGFRAALAAPQTQWRAVGIDAEPAQPLPAEILNSIASPQERHWLERLNLEFGDRILFSAKEATYKAWFPMTRRWLGFEDATVDVRSDGTFNTYLLVRPSPVPIMRGQWWVDHGTLITVVAVPAHGI